MREIKFRAWDKKNKCYYKPTYEAYKGNVHDLSIGLSGDLSIRTMDNTYHQSSFPNGEEYIIEQFTGLQDKNGKDIYEGDIIKYNYGNGNIFSGIIEYHNKVLKVGWEHDEILFIGFILRSCAGTSEEYFTEIPHLVEIKIIGDIHKNPEML